MLSVMAHTSQPTAQTGQLPPVQALWVGNKLGATEVMCMRSFLEHGHPYHLYTYNDIDNLPSGVELKDANAVLPASCVYATNYRGYAPFSDWFRWALFQERGGYWVDTDVLCLRPLDFSEDIVFGWEVFDPPVETRLGTAVIRMQAGHVLCSTMLQEVDKFVKRRLGSLTMQKLRKWRSVHRNQIIDLAKTFVSCDYSKYRLKVLKSVEDMIGPDGVTVAIQRDAPELLASHTQPTKSFFPLTPQRFEDIFTRAAEDVLDEISESYTLHIWATMIRAHEQKQGHDIVVRPNSFYEWMKDRYLSS